MSLPTTNTTCDIYRSGNNPPAPPDVPGVRCFLQPKGTSTLTTQNYTHVMLVAPTTDIRDAYSPGFTPGAQADKVYVPNQNGTLFTVVLVRRAGRGTVLDHKQVLLLRTTGATITWPTNDL